MSVGSPSTLSSPDNKEPGPKHRYAPQDAGQSSLAMCAIDTFRQGSNKIASFAVACPLLLLETVEVGVGEVRITVD